jgi:ACR3 family arsenite efflux pump ArsB
MSLIETAVNIATGFIVSMAVSHFVLPFFLGVTPTFAENFKITLVFTVFSFIRGYYVRRIFNRWYAKQLKSKTQG